jgi:hypothetical protein
MLQLRLLLHRQLLPDDLHRRPERVQCVQLLRV